MAGVVDHSQNEDVIFPLHVKDAKRELTEIGTADVLMNDGKTLRVSSDLEKDTIQIISKRKIQTFGLLGVPALGRQDIPFRRGAEPGWDHREVGQISALTSSQSRPSSAPALARRSSSKSLCHEGSG